MVFNHETLAMTVIINQPASLVLSLPLLLTSQIPGGSDLYSYYVDFETRRLESWEKIIPQFSYNPEVCDKLVHNYVHV